MKRWPRPRVVVTTDPELDDLNSMLRLLLHANEIDLVGLVTSASMFHYRGDPARGIAPHRWPAPGTPLHIEEALDAYAQVVTTLQVHDPRFPSVEQLRSITRDGNLDEVGDTREPTPGSELIVEVLLADDPRPVFLQAWGGLNTIARALLSIEERHDADEDWPQLHRRISEKSVITSFGQQDSTLADYIRPHWPGIEHREVATLTWGYMVRTVVRPEDAELLEAPWTRRYVSDVGPLGAAYRVWGDGRRMAGEFDPEDYFWLSGRSEDELRAEGYRVWAPVQEPGSWISEGDSSNAALLFDNGLRSWESGSYGGWGGRQVPNPEHEGAWTSGFEHIMGTHGTDGPGPVADRAPDGTTPVDFHTARWLRPIQQEFAARLRWSVTPRFEDANHPPVLTVDGGADRQVRPGESLELQGSATDPDGDAVALRWWIYEEAGQGGLHPTLEDDGRGTARILVPDDARPGMSIHAILEGTDAGTPPLTRYVRCILEVR